MHFLGKSNYLIKAENFRRSDRKIGHLYARTRAGIETRLRLARAYLARKESEFEAVREELAALRQELGVLHPAAATRQPEPS